MVQGQRWYSSGQSIWRVEQTRNSIDLLCVKLLEICRGGLHIATKTAVISWKTERRGYTELLVGITITIRVWHSSRTYFRGIWTGAGPETTRSTTAWGAWGFEGLRVWGDQWPLESPTTPGTYCLLASEIILETMPATETIVVWTHTWKRLPHLHKRDRSSITVEVWLCHLYLQE